MAKATSSKAPAEPVNSDQLAALEGTQQGATQPGTTQQGGGQQAAPTGVGITLGDLEERTVEAEERAQAVQLENDQLKATLAAMEARMVAIEKRSKEARKARAQETEEDLLPGEEPVFDESEPHGVVVGDDKVAYVQNGYQFGRDRQYICREVNRGVPRAFNPRLVGWVKPRPGAAAFDPFDGIRDKNW